MTVVEKIDMLRKERGWSVNKLAYEAALTQSTVANMFTSGSEPKISTLRLICDAFGISLSEFFYENGESEINPKMLDMLLYYKKLPLEEQTAIFELIKVMAKNK